MSGVIGYGKSPKGKVIHAIVEGGNALCDKRQVGLVVDENTTVSQVSCAKCKTYKVVKDTEDYDPQTMGLTSTVHKPKPKPKAKPKPKPKAKPKPKPKAEVHDYDFVSQKKGDDKFNIYHRPSKRNFFESIPLKVIDNAISNLNDMELRWLDSSKSIPDGFISGCRKAVKEAYEAVGLEPPKIVAEDPKPKKKSKKKKKVAPKSKTEKFKKGDELEINGVMRVFNGKKWIKKKKDKAPAEKPKRKIKRREKKAEPKKAKRVIKRREKKAEPKKSKRKIKRREKVETDQFGFKPGMQPAAIVELISGNGAQFGDIVEYLMSEFGLTQKRATTKSRRVIDKLARKFEANIVVYMGSHPDNDHYVLKD